MDRRVLPCVGRYRRMHRSRQQRCSYNNPKGRVHESLRLCHNSTITTHTVHTTAELTLQYSIIKLPVSYIPSTHPSRFEARKTRVLNYSLPYRYRYLYLFLPPLLLPQPYRYRMGMRGCFESGEIVDYAVLFFISFFYFIPSVSQGEIQYAASGWLPGVGLLLLTGGGF